MWDGVVVVWVVRCGLGGELDGWLADWLGYQVETRVGVEVGSGSKLDSMRPVDG